MKTLKWIAWISAGFGVVLLLLATISIVAGHSIGAQNIPSFFHAANSFFLLTIVLFLFIHLDQHKKA